MFINFFFFRKSCRLWGNVETTVEQGRLQMIIQRMRLACWITWTTNTQAGFVKRIVYSLQQSLQDHASMLQVHCLVCYLHHFICTYFLGLHKLMRVIACLVIQNFTILFMVICIYVYHYYLLNIGRGFRQRCCLSPFYSTCTANTLPRKILTALETSK